MSVKTWITALVRGGKDDEYAEISKTGDLYVAAGLPPLTELARRYGIVQAMNTSALAGLVVRPSTTSNITLFNKATSPNTLVLVRAYAFNLVSTAAENYFSLWLCSHPVGMTAPSTADIAVRNWTNGKAAGDGGHTILDVAETVVDDGWFPWGPIGRSEAVGVLPSGAVDARLDGAILVPPGAGISGQVVAGVTGQTFTMGFAWIPVPKDLLPIS